MQIDQATSHAPKDFRSVMREQVGLFDPNLTLDEAEARQDEVLDDPAFNFSYWTNDQLHAFVLRNALREAGFRAEVFADMDLDPDGEIPPWMVVTTHNPDPVPR